MRLEWTGQDRTMELQNKQVCTRARTEAVTRWAHACTWPRRGCSWSVELESTAVEARGVVPGAGHEH